MCQVPGASCQFGQVAAYSATGGQLSLVPRVTEEQRVTSSSRHVGWCSSQGSLVGTPRHMLGNTVCQAPVNWEGGIVDNHLYISHWWLYYSDKKREVYPLPHSRFGKDWNKSFPACWQTLCGLERLVLNTANKGAGSFWDPQLKSSSSQTRYITSFTSLVSLNSLRFAGFSSSSRKEVGSGAPQKSSWVMDLLGQMPAMQTREKKPRAAIHVLVQTSRKRNTEKPKGKKQRNGDPGSSFDCGSSKSSVVE